MQKQMNELDLQFLEMAFNERVPSFFTSVNSKSFYRSSIQDFQKLNSYSDNYIFMSSLKKGSLDKENHILKTSKNNVSSVHGFTVDIDAHNDNLDLDNLILAIQFFIDESNLPLHPTAYVNSGRGVHLHYLFEKPIFLNNSKAKRVIELAYSELKNQLNTQVLHHLDLQCDPNINPIAQKIRCPGTYNFKSNSYSHVVDLKNCFFHCGAFLTSIHGEYLQKSFKKKKKTTLNTKRVNKNLPVLLKSRIETIQKAMIFTSTVMNDGFRNNGYVALAWQSLNYQSKEDTVLLLNETDQQLKNPYFNNYDEIVSFVNSLTKTIDSSKNFRLKNNSIFEYCVALQVADKYNIQLPLNLKTKTNKDLLLENRKVRKEKKQEIIEFLMNYIKDEKIYLLHFKEISEKFKISRQTLYNYLYKILNINNYKQYILFLNKKCFNKKTGKTQKPLNKVKLINKQRDYEYIDFSLLL